MLLSHWSQSLPVNNLWVWEIRPTRVKMAHLKHNIMNTFRAWHNEWHWTLWRVCPFHNNCTGTRFFKNSPIWIFWRLKVEAWPLWLTGVLTYKSLLGLISSNSRHWTAYFDWIIWQITSVPAWYRPSEGQGLSTSFCEWSVWSEEKKKLDIFCEWIKIFCFYIYRIVWEMSYQNLFWTFSGPFLYYVNKETLLKLLNLHFFFIVRD